MAAARDLTGERFGRLVAETLLYRKSRRYWVCRCDCGRTTRPVEQCDLIDGRTRSCGCLLAEAAAAKGRGHGAGASAAARGAVREQRCRLCGRTFAARVAERYCSGGCRREQNRRRLARLRARKDG